MIATVEGYLPEHSDILIEWLSSEPWPYHGQMNPTREDVKRWIDNNTYFNDEVKTFWIICDKHKAGLLKISDVSDDTPIFDIRIKSGYRKNGLGLFTMKWLIEYTFTVLDKRRLEGHTRIDNKPMRNLFLKAGFIKEAHHRKAWPDNQGNYYDSIGYGILREDWRRNKTTPLDWFND